MWRFNEFDVEQGSPIIIDSESTEGLDYNGTLTAISNRPIEIYKIIYTSTNQAVQIKNNLIAVHRSLYGSVKQHEISIIKYTNPIYPFFTVEIEFEENIIADLTNFMQMAIEGNTEVVISFFYKQVDTVGIINESLREIKPLLENNFRNADDNKILTSADNEGEENIQNNDILNLRFLAVVIVSIIIYRLLKQKKIF